jgi:biotin carboxyl carrier protein
MNKVHDVDVREEKGEFVITIEQKEYRLKEYTVQGYEVSYSIENKPRRAYCVQDNDTWYLAIAGEYYVVKQMQASRESFKGAAAAESDTIASTMPGLLVKIAVAVGGKVKAVETMAIVEAMKMQTELCAPRDGIVKKVNFKEGEQVDAFQAIVELESIGK